MSDIKIGFGTLALGPEYQTLAKLLAYDLLCFHPDKIFYILTDEPQVFSDFSNVRAVLHNFGGIRYCYHDKRFVINAVLAEENVCVFLDADTRLLSEVDFSSFLSSNKFLVSLHSKNLVEKLKIEIDMDSKGWINASVRKNIFEKLCNKFQVNMDRVQYVQEAFFVVNKNNGNYKKFMQYWDESFYYTTSRLLEYSEGSSIGISAEAAGCEIGSLDFNPPWHFKDLYVNDWKNNSERAISENMKVLRESIGRGEKKSRFKILLKLYRCFRFFLNWGMYKLSKIINAKSK